MHHNLKEADGLIMPSISSSDLNLYIDSCLNIAPLSKNNKEQVLRIHSFLVPDTWFTEEERRRVKVEVDPPSQLVKNTSGQIRERNKDARIEEEEEGDDHGHVPLDQKPDAKDSSKPKLEPYRCRYDSTCSVAFRSIKAINCFIHFIIRNPLCIGSKGFDLTSRCAFSKWE